MCCLLDVWLLMLLLLLMLLWLLPEFELLQERSNLQSNQHPVGHCVQTPHWCRNNDATPQLPFTPSSTTPCTLAHVFVVWLELLCPLSCLCCQVPLA